MEACDDDAHTVPVTNLICLRTHLVAHAFFGIFAMVSIMVMLHFLYLCVGEMDTASTSSAVTLSSYLDGIGLLKVNGDLSECPRTLLVITIGDLSECLRTLLVITIGDLRECPRTLLSSLRPLLTYSGHLAVSPSPTRNIRVLSYKVHSLAVVAALTFAS